MSPHIRRALTAFAVLVLALLATARPALAHGFSSTVFLHVSGEAEGRIRTDLALEYDLFVVSAADAAHDDALFRAGTAAFEDGDAKAQAEALDAHAKSALAYVEDRFAATSGGSACTPARVGGFTMDRREGVPYTHLLLDWDCADRESTLAVRGTLFPDAEGYVKGTKTIATYDVAGRSGSAALDAAHPSFSVEQTWYERFWEFFRLGAEHLLGGIDHILFLLALIVGSRRPREIVLAATSFTIAHSVTFLLAALGAVDVPARVVEPVIALSIAVVAGGWLWRLARGRAEGEAAYGDGPLGLDRTGWTRLGVVFCFGLVHGLGFAGALGIDEAWSWTLLWSLLVFNIGIEAVQLGLIALVFPLLLLLRRRAPRTASWVTGAISAGVAAMGLVWCVQRVLEG
ncbi:MULTISPECIES: HupE/UreJ family protein [unclassified Streptomyces]|uniref:HupE/UreJ family protein n=1 Tax=unclassified Streptomyces TaxID=2593676 RepID=UPI00081ED231|nr:MULTISPECIES: HupE/UreJ family protein [unclassified Streptomyces]MYR26786.1 HupE/UreJ family protein [Streptomyces sp. SID4945]SCF11153.1 HupE / UreJ protein [Streptomyces sp. LcepLS]